MWQLYVSLALTAASAAAAASTAALQCHRRSGFFVCCSDRNHLSSERCYFEGESPVPESSIVMGDVIEDSYEAEKLSWVTLTTMPDAVLKNAVRDSNRKWPNATVPYVFHKSFSSEDKKKIRKSMDYIEKKTCVRFVHFAGDGDCVLITNDHGCHATLGYNVDKWGSARVNLHDKSCLKRKGTVQHELLHLLGLKHEQERPDRDAYVEILWDNIKPEHKKNFKKADPRKFTTFGLPYDYKSVMHYSNFEFTMNSEPTIVAKKDREMILGQRKRATDQDLGKIRRMYCQNGQELEIHLN